MQYRQLGRSGLKVSELCLGTMNFGSRTSPQAAQDILSAAMEAGINFIDTANQYGGDGGVGMTETIIGQWLAQDPNRRHNAVIVQATFRAGRLLRLTSPIATAPGSGI